jgi:hypothetical protein
MIHRFARFHAAAAALISLTGLSATAQARPGPDVTYQDVSDVTSYGLVGTTRGYALGTATCNMGNMDLMWLGNGTPAVAMNAYRLHNGRLLQIGMGWCKTACCAGAGTGCSVSCNGHGGNVLGAGCRDVYGGGWNGIQTRLAPRSAINAFSGAIGSFSGASGDAIFRRLQVQQNDLSSASFPGALYFVEGEYVGTDDAAAGNALNNATYRRVTVNTAYDLVLAGSTASGLAAINAWHAHGLGVNVPDPSVTITNLDVPSEGRFIVATKVTQLPGGTYLYDYAIFNHNSDRSGGSLSVPVGTGVTVSGVGFHDVAYHSGEVYDNTDWTSTISAGSVSWQSPQTFAQNPNSNALRWGTMYNFWFEATTPPVNGTATLGLFKPGSPSSVTITVPTPSGIVCPADFNHDDIVNSQDYFDFVTAFFAGNADFNHDGSTTSQDYFDFVDAFFTPC